MEKITEKITEKISISNILEINDLNNLEKILNENNCDYLIQNWEWYSSLVFWWKQLFFLKDENNEINFIWKNLWDKQFLIQNIYPKDKNISLNIDEMDCRYLSYDIKWNIILIDWNYVEHENDNIFYFYDKDDLEVSWSWIVNNWEYKCIKWEDWKNIKWIYNIDSSENTFRVYKIWTTMWSYEKYLFDSVSWNALIKDWKYIEINWRNSTNEKSTDTSYEKRISFDYTTNEWNFLKKDGWYWYIMYDKDSKDEILAWLMINWKFKPIKSEDWKNIEWIAGIDTDNNSLMIKKGDKFRFDLGNAYQHISYYTEFIPEEKYLNQVKSIKKFNAETGIADVKLINLEEKSISADLEWKPIIKNWNYVFISLNNNLFESFNKDNFKKVEIWFYEKWEYKMLKFENWKEIIWIEKINTNDNEFLLKAEDRLFAWWVKYDPENKVADFNIKKYNGKDYYFIQSSFFINNWWKFFKVFDNEIRDELKILFSDEISKVTCPISKKITETWSLEEAY